MIRKRPFDSDTSSETDVLSENKRVKLATVTVPDAPKSSPARSLGSHTSLPQVLASLRVFTFGGQAACVSYEQPVSSTCWSSKLCVEAGSANACGLTQAPVFMHAFDMVCNSLLAGSVDIVTALLPHVHDVPAFLEARPSVQRHLESFLRGEQPLCWQLASTSQLREFPAGAVAALSSRGGLQSRSPVILCSPFFVNACHSFAWGTIGYIHMLLECQRLICYLLIGHVLPAVHSGSSSWDAEASSGSCPPGRRSKLLMLPHTAAHGEQAAHCTQELHIGLDPGLWALSQLFHCTWAHACSPPVTMPSQNGPQHARQGCLFCADALRKQNRQAPETLATAHSEGMTAPAMAETTSCRILRSPKSSSGECSIVQACITCTAAPLLVAEVPASVPPNHPSLAQPSGASMQHQLGSGIRIKAPPGPNNAQSCGATHAAVVWPEGGRFGTRLHDVAPQEHVIQLLHVLRDHLEPHSDQVRGLGSFRSLPWGDSQNTPEGASQDGAASMLDSTEDSQIHVDLLQGTWGGAVRDSAVHAEVAQRQGQQGLVPGTAGGQFAGFFVPALSLTPAMLSATVQALDKCDSARLWTGCHQ